MYQKLETIYQDSFSLAKKYFALLLLFGAVNLGINYFEIYILPLSPSLLSYKVLFSLFLPLWSQFIFAFIIIYIHSKENSNSSSLGFLMMYSLKRVIPLFIVFIVYFISLLLGLILLVIPGLIILLKLSQVHFITLIEGTNNPFKAILASNQLTKGNLILLFILYLSLGLPLVVLKYIYTPPIVLLIISHVFTVYFYMLSYAIWRFLRKSL